MSSTPDPPGALQSPRCHAQQQQSRSRPAALTSSSSSSSSSSGRHTNDKRRCPFPFSTTHPFRPNPSSTSLAPSTAEGKAIPVDDTMAKHRTLALREINSHYPSRQQYAKSTGARSNSNTYSEPVIVRTYYSPAPSRHDASSRRQRQSGCSGAGSKAGGPGIGAARGVAFAVFANQPSPAARGGGMLSKMARACTGKASAVEAPPGAQLPPKEAFRFKSFMASTNTEAQAGAADINSDLDRIAEICARSSYSLSNQYEVHYAPNGSGASFLVSGQNQASRGLTLRSDAWHGEQDLQGMMKRRRRVGRKSSRAACTLETIMSSSRSSDEENAKKKNSASELAAGVRGRAEGTMQTSRRPSAAASPLEKRAVVSKSEDEDDQQEQHRQQPQPQPQSQPRSMARRPSASLALMDNSRQTGAPMETSRRRASSSALVSEPSLPQASVRQLETRTASATPLIKPRASPNARSSSAPQAGMTDAHLSRGSISPTRQQGMFGRTTVSSISGWLPWMHTSVRPKLRGRAESSLRDLLHHTEHNCRSAGSSVG
ncbi:hypothetical protein E4U55_000634 [Claviceps digitariae]|nr:hypothetical protein E4U55_000634 [Claviceps digitariae]